MAYFIIFNLFSCIGRRRHRGSSTVLRESSQPDVTPDPRPVSICRVYRGRGRVAVFDVAVGCERSPIGKHFSSGRRSFPRFPFCIIIVIILFAVLFSRNELRLVARRYDARRDVSRPDAIKQPRTECFQQARGLGIAARKQKAANTIKPTNY